MSRCYKPSTLENCRILPRARGFVKILSVESMFMTSNVDGDESEYNNISSSIIIS